MTDEDRWLALMAEFGVEPKREPTDPADCSHVYMVEFGTPNVTGYGGFWYEAVFDQHGKFENFGVWE